MLCSLSSLPVPSALLRHLFLSKRKEKNIGESIKDALKHVPNFHFNFCVTSRADVEGEWHDYLTSGSRNCIFSYADDPDGSSLRKADSIADLQFIPMIRHIACEENGFDTFICALEDYCQAAYHKVVPVGTLSYRKRSKDNPQTIREDRVWTLYFSFSPNNLLDCVEKGEYKANKTKYNRLAQERYNYDVWDPASWVGVDIP